MRSHVRRRFCTTGIALLLFVAVSRSVVAADVTTTISEQALKDFASAVGSIQGSGSYTYMLTLPALRPASMTAPTTALTTSQIVISPHKVTFGKFRFQTINWSWQVVRPAFTISPNGIRFTAFLSVSDGTTTTFQTVSLPATVMFDAASSTLRLNVTGAAVPLIWNVLGQATQIGSANLSQYFNAGLYIGPRTFAAGGINVTGRVTNVAVQYLNGAVRVTSDVQF